MKSKTTLLLLKTSAFLVFIGRAYQHLFWDAPFRCLLKDEHLLKPITTHLFGIDWNNYITILGRDANIQTLIKLQGFVYLIMAFVVVFIHSNSKKWMRIVLYIGGFSLVFLSFLLCKEKSYQIPQFFEHSIQFGVVFLLLFYLKNLDDLILLFYIKVLIAITFVSHGIYALGVFYPIPSNFVTMVLNTLPIKETLVVNALFVMGVMDVLVALFVFVPKLAKWILFYAFIWGTLTALARIVSGLHYEISFQILHQYLFETVYRLSHGLLPLSAYLLVKNLNLPRN